MSSIQNLRNQYDQLRLQSISSQYTKTGSSTKSSEAAKSYFQSDDIQISEEGLAALEANRSNPPHINALEELVSNGTITEEQSEKIQEAFESNRASGVRPTEGTSPLQSLIDDGTITEEQDDAIKATFDSMKPMGKPHGKPPMGPPPVQGNEETNSSTNNLLDEDTINALLKSLSESGTITDDQQSAISSALDSLLSKLYGSDDDESTSTAISTL